MLAGLLLRSLSPLPDNRVFEFIFRFGKLGDFTCVWQSSPALPAWSDRRQPQITPLRAGM